MNELDTIPPFIPQLPKRETIKHEMGPFVRLQTTQHCILDEFFNSAFALVAVIREFEQLELSLITSAIRPTQNSLRPALGVVVLYTEEYYNQ